MRFLSPSKGKFNEIQITNYNQRLTEQLSKNNESNPSPITQNKYCNAPIKKEPPQRNLKSTTRYKRIKINKIPKFWFKYDFITSKKYAKNKSSKKKQKTQIILSKSINLSEKGNAVKVNFATLILYSKWKILVSFYVIFTTFYINKK